MSCINKQCQGGFIPGPVKVLDGHNYPTYEKCPDCEKRHQERTTKPVFRQPRVEKPPDDTRGKNRDLKSETMEWIKTHSRAAERIRHDALMLAGIGMKVRVKHLVERIREYGVKEGWEPFEYQIDNGYTAYIARWLIEVEPEKLRDAIEFRVAKWDTV